MSNERDNLDLKSYADRLRGIDPKALGQAQEAGKQLGQHGKLQEVSENSGPRVTPRVQQDQEAPASRHRHILDKEQQALIGRPGGGAPPAEPVKAPQQEKAAETRAPQQSVAAVGKESNLKEAARRLRENGASVKREAANEVAPPKQTPEVHKREDRGRGR